MGGYFIPIDKARRGEDLQPFGRQVYTVQTPIHIGRNKLDFLAYKSIKMQRQAFGRESKETNKNL
jgi:hypothetical protein